MEKLKPSYTVGGIVKKSAGTLYSRLTFLQKVKQLLYDLSIPLLGVYLKEFKIFPHKNLYTSIYNNSNNKKGSPVFTNWWIDKWGTYSGVLFVCNKNEVVIHAVTWMHLEKLCLVKNTRHKRQQDLYDFIYVKCSE